MPDNQCPLPDGEDRTVGEVGSYAPEPEKNCNFLSDVVFYVSSGIRKKLHQMILCCHCI